MTKQYYKQDKYDGFETDYRILEAIETITGTDILDLQSAAYGWWSCGGSENLIIDYLNEHFPDWKNSAPLHWGLGGILANETCY